MIKNAGILGLGALGGMYGSFLTKAIGSENVYILGDKERLERYSDKGVYINGVKADFNYAFESTELDLLIVATKFHHLRKALESAKAFVTENTIVISLLNGITSEEVIADVLGKGRIFYCVACGYNTCCVLSLCSCACNSHSNYGSNRKCYKTQLSCKRR